MQRITITVREDIYDLLPKRDRSAFINLVLKQHFQYDNADELYKVLSARFKNDPELLQELTSRVQQALQESQRGF